MSTTKMDDQGVIVICPACGQKNRTAFARLSETGKCGRCQAAIPPPGIPVEVDSSSQFERLVRSSSVPVVVDYWAPWCAPCRMVAPELEKVAASGAGKYIIAKVNTEALPELGQKYNIRSIPTLAVFSGGQEVNRSSGARPAADIEQFIGKTLA